ncbi:MAG: hypothetical protein ACT4O3_01370 [Elusimicrobiota bacterium]
MKKHRLKADPALRRFWWTLAFPALLIFFIYPLRIHGGINPQDEGIWLAVAQALSEGKRLYRDIAFQYGPLLASALELPSVFGSFTLSGARTTVWLFNAAGLLCVYAALLSFVRDARTRLAAGVFLCMVPLAAHTLFIPMSARYGPAFLPMVFWPGAPWHARRPRAAPWAAGALAGLSYWFAQEAGAPALAAGLFVFAGGKNKKPLAAFAAAAAGALGLGLAAVAWRGGSADYFRSSVFDIGYLMAAIRRGPAAFPGELLAAAAGGRAAWNAAAAGLADFLAVRLIPLSCAGAFLYWAFRKRRDADFRPLAALALQGFLASGIMWVRSDRWHIYLAAAPGLLLWAALTDRTLRGSRKTGERALLLFFVLGGAVTLPHFYVQRVREAAGRDHRRESSLPRAGRSRLPDAQANGYEFLGDWISRRTAPGEPIFLFPYNGAVYFLADRPNPSRFPMMADAVRPDQQAAAVGQMEAAGLRWIIHDTQNTHFDAKPVEEFLPVIYAYMRDKFEEAERAGPFVFLKRKGTP